MPAYILREKLDRPRERLRALLVAVLVQAALAFALFRGLEVETGRPADVVQRLIAITLPPTPRRLEPALVRPRAKPEESPHRSERSGSSGGPGKAAAPLSVAPVVAVQAPAAPSGGGVGSGSAAGPGSGQGEGGSGSGAGGGRDLEQIAGEITPRDYPRRLGNAGIGGRVGVSFTVGVNGRVTRCVITRSSGVAELDALTCRLIEERFLYRPSTDRFGRPIPDQVEGEHEWTAGR